MPRFRPTHRLTLPKRGSLLVMLVDGVAYTRQEWKTATSADYECVDGQWLFQGQPFAGTIRCLAANDEAKP